MFSPAKRDPAFRHELGFDFRGPLLVYAGRVDNEKRADRLVAMIEANVSPTNCRVKVNVSVR